MTTCNRIPRGSRAARPAIAPITRAIRHSLFATAALVALSLPAAASAGGACAHAASTQRCEIGRLQTRDAGDRIDDPSLVLEAATPVAVQSGFAGLLPTDFEAGIVVLDPYSASLDNADPITVGAYASGDASAYGAIAGSGPGGYSSLNNTADGTIDVVADSVSGTALAVGLYAYAGAVAALANYGDVSASASSGSGAAQAYAAIAVGVPAGIGRLINGGSLQADAYSGSGEADATGAYVVADVASIFNDATITASASSGADGSAVARGAAVNARYGAVYNYGDISVSADGGIAASATGIEVRGFYGVTAYNAGTLDVTASADGTAYAAGSSAIASTSAAYSTNLGSIAVAADGASAQANGMVNAALYVGDAITSNSGTITVTATGGIAPYGSVEAAAQGIYNLAYVYDSVVDNTGSISATALALADISGTTGFLQAKAVGIAAMDVLGYGDVVVDNGGSIAANAQTSQGYASAWGVAVTTSGQYAGAARIDNSGGIHAYAHADIGTANAIATYARNPGGDVTTVNYGDTAASARAERGIVNVSVNYAYATGMKLASYYGSVILDNHASIAAQASAEGGITGARGVQAAGGLVSITNAEGASITATGEVDLFGGGFATGIEASGVYGINIANDGDIDVYGHAHAYSDGVYGFYGSAVAVGIYAAANTRGNVAIANNGDIIAFANAEDSLSFAQGGAGATGVNAYAKYDATIVNAGDISAIARTEFGISSANGVIGHGKYTTHVVNAAGASILAEASAGSSPGDSYDGRAVTFGVHVFGRGMEYGLIENAGSIVSHASVSSGQANANPGIASAWGASVGAYSSVIAGAVVNQGDIEATASADFGSATAYGSYILTATHANTTNQGTIFASADASGGDAWSVGSIGRAVEQEYHVPCHVVDGPYGSYNQCDYSNAYFVTVGGDAALENAGQITSIARAAGGVARSYGVVSLGGFYASIANSGRIDALAEADDALAVGALANALYGTAIIDNGGIISAVARGDLAVTKGVDALGREGAQVRNTGTITATATGADATAIAVALDASGSNVLDNTGTIAAFGDGTRIAVSSALDASADITNSGTLLGAIVTGGLDDSLVNASGGTWLALGDSDFGDGDDSITNHGSVILQDASISLGGYASGNAFANDGTLMISGSNAIDMGGSFNLVNSGTIDFIDGATDDTLAVNGGLDGNGALRFDADLAAQAGDQLQLTGGMDAASVQAVDVNVFGVPLSAHEHIELVTATATLDGDFSLRSLHNSGADFLIQSFALSQSAHSLALDMDVTGLNDAGTLAVTAASAAAGMLQAQVGTFRQRLGVDPYGDSGKVMSAFIRSYSGQGDVDPAHVASNFGQGGNFAYDLSSWGNEIGVNANLFGDFHIGLVAGQAEGRQRLTGGGVGSNRMDGTSWGVYASWYAPEGFYVDLSGRWMAVDVRSSSTAGTLQSRAHTGAWNLEAGYRWTFGGLSVVPQLQYTRTTVSGIDPLVGSVATVLGHGGTSSRTRLGVELSHRFDTASGWQVTPFGSLNWIRESDGTMRYTVAGNFQGMVSDQGSSAMAEVGVGVQKGRWAVSLGGYWLDGGAHSGGSGAQAVVRLAW